MTKHIKSFGILAIGPPGSGKTTFCNGLHQFLTALGRPSAVINLDPANDIRDGDFTEAPAVDITDLITVQDAMEEYSLGPNGGLMYCMQFLETNFEWLQSQISNLIQPSNASITSQKPIDDNNNDDGNCSSDDLEPPYLIIDCPGQVELYTHDSSLQTIINKLVTDCHLSLCTVHLVDISHCSDPARFISVLLLAMKTMLHLELPHINVLSKIDLLASQNLSFNLDFYTEVQDLRYLLTATATDNADSTITDLADGDNSTVGVDMRRTSRFMKKFERLNEALVELIEDFNLVSFHTLYVEDKESMWSLVKTIDKANGYVFGAGRVNETILDIAMKVGDDRELQEKFTQ